MLFTLMPELIILGAKNQKQIFFSFEKTESMQIEVTVFKFYSLYNSFYSLEKCIIIL